MTEHGHTGGNTGFLPEDHCSVHARARIFAASQEVSYHRHSIHRHSFSMRIQYTVRARISLTLFCRCRWWVRHLQTISRILHGCIASVDFLPRTWLGWLAHTLIAFQILACISSPSFRGFFERAPLHPSLSNITRTHSRHTCITPCFCFHIHQIAWIYRFTPCPAL